MRAGAQQPEGTRRSVSRRVTRRHRQSAPVEPASPARGIPRPDRKSHVAPQCCGWLPRPIRINWRVIADRQAAMDVLALVTQKGGTGKSSLAVSLAVAAVERGLKVAVIDTDPQGTAANWHTRRQAEAPEVATVAWSQLSSRLYALSRDGYDLVVVDTPGSDSHAANAAIREAHLCLLPVR